MLRLLIVMSLYGAIISSVVCFAMAAGDDLYSVLGVNKLSSANEIRQAYKNLAKEWHPDKNRDPAASEKFMKINEAYETLSNEEKRSQYDTYGTTAFQSGDEKRWSDTEFSGPDVTFNFGGFSFSFAGSPFESYIEKYRLGLRSFEDVVITDSRLKPYIIFVYSDYCDECDQVGSIWEHLVQDLIKAGIGIGTVNSDAEKVLTRKLRVSSFPAVVGVIDGRRHKFTKTFDLQNLREFTRNLFPNDLIEQVSNSSAEPFLNSWNADNRVRMIFFDQRKLPPLRFVASAFAFRRHVAAGYVNMIRLESDHLIVNHHLNRSQENFLVFKEDTVNPALTITLPEIARQEINEVLEANKFLALPRISYPSLFYDYCLPLSPVDNRKLCIILMSRKIPQHDIYRNSFREFAKRHLQDRVKFGYVYEETQPSFVRLITWGAGSVNETLGTLKVAMLWHREPKLVHYDLFDWHASGSDLQRSRRKLKQVMDWLLQTGDVMPYVVQLRSEILDENAPIIWIRILRRIHVWMDRAWDKLLSVDEVLLLTVATTAILVVVIGMVVRTLMITEDTIVQKTAQRQNKQKSVVGKKTTVESSGEVDGARPTVHIVPLCCENYEDLILEGSSGVQLLVILVDETSRAKLLQYFAWILLPYLKSNPYKVAFLQLEEYLPWYRSILQATLGMSDNSFDLRQNLTHINPRNCLGTVLAINGRRKFYHLYHYSTMKSNGGWIDDDLPDDESDQELKSDAKKLFESDLVHGLGRWMNQLSNGKLRKYRVAFWPDMKT